MAGEPKNVTVPWVAAAPGRGDHLVMVTAYDYPQGRAADAAGVDIVLVGDSLAMVVLGHPDTLSVTMDEMIHHTKAVRRGVKRALLVADMPYGSFHLGTEQAVGNAVRFVKEAGAQAVKIEGARAELVAAMTAAELPVMAHLGLTPQSLHRLGGFKVQGRDEAARRFILEAAEEVEAAGAFSLVLECVPSDSGGRGHPPPVDPDHRHRRRRRVHGPSAGLSRSPGNGGADRAAFRAALRRAGPPFPRGHRPLRRGRARGPFPRARGELRRRPRSAAGGRAGEAVWVSDLSPLRGWPSLP